MGQKVAAAFFGFGKGKDDEGSAWWPLEACETEPTVFRGSGGPMELAMPAAVPGTLTGILSKPGERHWYLVELTKGQKIQLRAEAKAFHSPAELEVVVTDAAGREQRRAVENPQEEITLDFQANQPGTYGIIVRELQSTGQ